MGMNAETLPEGSTERAGLPLLGGGVTEWGFLTTTSRDPAMPHDCGGADR